MFFVILREAKESMGLKPLILPDSSLHSAALRSFRMTKRADCFSILFFCHSERSEESMGFRPLILLDSSLHSAAPRSFRMTKRADCFGIMFFVILSEAKNPWASSH